MKIVVDGIIFERQFYGGVSRIYHEILPRMCAANYSLQVTILTSGPLRQAVPQQTCLNHQPLPPSDRWLRPGRFFWRQQRQLRSLAKSRWMQQYQPDIWHSTFFTLPYRWQGMVVTTIYDLIYERFPHFFNSSQANWTRRQMKLSMQRADAVICISDTTKQDVVEFYGVNPAKLHVIPLAPGKAFFHHDYKESFSDIQRPYILYVGKRINHKNFVTLLLAYSCWSKNREIDLIVIGEPWSEIEREMLEKNNIADRIRLLANVDDNKLSVFYNQALALVYPSLYEGFGLPLLEAMACACPVVASRIPTNVEVAEGCAIYFKAEDVSALIVALDQVVEDGRFSKRVQRGLQQAKSYSWDKTAQQTMAIYRKISG